MAGQIIHSSQGLDRISRSFSLCLHIFQKPQRILDRAHYRHLPIPSLKKLPLIFGQCSIFSLDFYKYVPPKFPDQYIRTSMTYCVEMEHTASNTAQRRHDLLLVSVYPGYLARGHISSNLCAGILMPVSAFANSGAVLPTTMYICRPRFSIVPSLNVARRQPSNTCPSGILPCQSGCNGSFTMV